MEFQRVSNDYFEKEEGFIKSHTKAQYKLRNTVTFTALQEIYVDDGAFSFESREQFKRGPKVINDHFSRFGIETHVGKSIKGNIKASKTEYDFFKPQLFDNKISSCHEEIEGENDKYLSTEGYL